jgi:hypothetical protein
MPGHLMEVVQMQSDAAVTEPGETSLPHASHRSLMSASLRTPRGARVKCLSFKSR